MQGRPCCIYLLEDQQELGQGNVNYHTSVILTVQPSCKAALQKQYASEHLQAKVSISRLDQNVVFKTEDLVEHFKVTQELERGATLKEPIMSKFEKKEWG